MARRGRKRKAGKRWRNGNIARTQTATVDRGTPEMQALRLATTKDKTLSPDYPLAILLGRGLLVRAPVDDKDPGEDPRLGQMRHDAGRQYALNSWALFGQPFAKSQNYQQGGGGSGMSDRTERMIRDDYEAARRVLDQTGTTIIIEDLAVYLRRGWLINAILRGGGRKQDCEARLVKIRAGLDALAAVLPARREAA